MKQQVIGLCKKCLGWVRVSRIYVNEKHPENFRIYVCKYCILKELEKPCQLKLGEC